MITILPSNIDGTMHGMVGKFYEVDIKEEYMKVRVRAPWLALQIND